jgi:hypothetical protein
MHSVIEAEMVAALDEVYDLFGEAATYNADPVTVMSRYRASDSQGDPSVVAPEIEIRVRRSEVARPVPGDAVTMDGVDYVVSDEPNGSSMEWTVSLVEDVS